MIIEDKLSNCQAGFVDSAVAPDRPMPRETLLDFFADLSRTNGTFLVHDDGFRVRSWTYREVAAAAEAFAHTLGAHRIGADDKVIVWGENRPEWIVAFWGTVLRGAIVVPIDYRASPDFLGKVARIVEASAVLVGEDVELPPGTVAAAIPVWRLAAIGSLPAALDSSGLAAPEPGKAKADAAPTARRAPFTPTRDTTVEIIFTSGATAEPKGVVITHRNILANIVPIEHEMQKYRGYARPFMPLRFLNLLPLSHMFGQAMATFVPPMLAGEVVFMRSLRPRDIVQQIKARRISVLVSVPKILDVLRDHISREFPDAAVPHPGPMHWSKRWWTYRNVHRAFGWKFWAAVVGAAPLDPGLEEYWGRLGFLVVQGYGLTETAPIVTLNHPLKTRRGSVGKPIAGVEVKIAEDGEILVRGDNVTKGYYGAPEATAEAFADGWLHTGDIGGTDEQGRMYIKGRKKEMIVTPEGLNVFPEDVERALTAIDGVRDAAVVGRTFAGEERVHAVVVADAGVDLDAVVQRANQSLGDHQKIRSASAWPGAELPRTDGTRKLKRREVKRWVEGDTTATATAAGDRRAGSVLAAVQRFAPGRSDIGPATPIESLGLSSLERVELLMAIEEQAQTTIDEAAFAEARTVADLATLAGEGATGEIGSADGRPKMAAAASAGALAKASEASDGPVTFPTWNRRWPFTWIRNVSLLTWILPIGRAFAWVKVEGLEHLENLPGPVVFAANHQSHLDGPMVLWSLPARWRYRIAIAMAKEFFKAHFFPEQYGRKAWFTSSLNYYLSTLFFNAFPLPQREAGTRQTLRYIGALFAEGYSLLIFPEGKRTSDGQLNPFRGGIGMIGARLDVPVIPVGISGLDQVLHHTWKMAKPGPARIRFGPPLRLQGDDYAALAKQVEDAVRLLVQ
jgi:long-chain acyl-CoA synthetase